RRVQAVVTLNVVSLSLLTPSPVLSPLSLHDALPICRVGGWLAAARRRRRAVRVAPAAPRRRRHIARSRGGPGRVRSGAARALRVRLRRAGTALLGGGGVAHPAAADAPLSLGAAVLRRARSAGGGGAARNRQSPARARRDGLPRDHGPPRVARPRLRRALRAALEHRARGDR